MNKLIMVGGTTVIHAMFQTETPVIVFRSTLFNFPHTGRLLVGGVATIERILIKNQELFAHSVYKIVGTSLFTKGDTFFVSLGESNYGAIKSTIKLIIQEHFGEVDCVDCEEDDASALLIGVV